jgi:hypothetical protein
MQISPKREYRVIIARQEVSRLTKAKDHVKGGAGQFDLVNLTNRLNEFVRDGWVVRFSNATNIDETGKLVIYNLLERVIETQ